MRKNENFDVVLAKDCARAFTTSTGLGTVVSLADGEPLATYGTYHCENCRICQLAGKQHTLSNQGFLSKAPAQQIENERVKLAKAQEKMEKIMLSIEKMK